MSISDRIEKQVTLKASVSRVWRAISDPVEFGTWFGVKLEGPFVPGQEVRGTWDGEMDEAMIMEAQRRMGLVPGKLRRIEKNAVFGTIEQVVPERYFSFRWIPFGIDAEVDPKHEPTTLVELTLEAVPEGTRLTIVESGFDRVPASRRERAFRMNTGGWAAQAENIRKHVEAR